jgi:chorismate synthase
MLRFLDAGESHGKALIAIIDGFPSKLKIDLNFINKNLMLRQSGYGRGGRQKIERDRVEFLSGVRFLETIGSPTTMAIYNKDFENWENIMSYDAEYSEERRVVSPRPGHADLTGYIKYDRTDMRDVLERSSARETAIRVAVGSLCEYALLQIGVKLIACTKAIGSVECSSIDYENSEIESKIEKSPVFCPDEKISDLMIAEIEEAKKQKDTIGGAIEVYAKGVIEGLGSYSQWDKKLDAKLSYALMSIQAVKAVEIGEGFNNSKRFGSNVHDEIEYNRGYVRKTNRAGGVEGGMSNGEPIIARAYMKPIPTLQKGLESVDIQTKTKTKSAFERSDVCAVPALGVVAKSVVAYELFNAYLEKFGSDTMDELKRRVDEYKEYVLTK